MQQWEESGLTLTFGSGWRVRPYDRHPYYQGLAGQGMKGVDFLCLRGREELVLIEIKNFLPPADNPWYPTLARSLADPEAYAAMIQQKWSDTLRGIRVVRKYYQRLWRYRWGHSLVRQIYPDAEWTFWTEAFTLSRQADCVCCLLWLVASADQQQQLLTGMGPAWLENLDKRPNGPLLFWNAGSPLPGIQGNLGRPRN